MTISPKVKNNLIDISVVIIVTIISIYLLPAIAALFARLSLKLGRTLFIVHSTILGYFLPHTLIGLLQGIVTARLIRNRRLFVAMLPAIFLFVFDALYFSFGPVKFHWRACWFSAVIIVSWILLIISAFLSARWVLKRRNKIGDITTKSMSIFEKWQVSMTVTQTVILLLTVIVALYIGIKQIEISNRQTEISESLAKLPYIVSVEIIYNADTKKLNIYNKGQTNIYLWGTKLGDESQNVEEEPRLITPGGFYYLLADTLESNLLKSIGENGEAKEVLEIYITNLNATKYVISTIIFAKTMKGQLTIHTQTTPIKPQEW